jgi:hypothetical protein
MIIKTNKKSALELIECATRRLEDETFLQCNMVGIDWIFIVANNNWYIEVRTDTMRSQFEIRAFNKYNEMTTNEWYNVTRPTMQAIHDLLSKKQNQYVYGLEY